MEKIKYFTYQEYKPHSNIPLLLDTQFGIRHGYYVAWADFFKLTDCNHPLQNTHLSPDHLNGWAYEKKEHYFMYPLVENRSFKRQEAEKMLEAVKPTWFEWMSLYLWNFIKKH